MSEDAELLAIASDARAEGRPNQARAIARQAIRLPEIAQGLPVIASVSGGKDSTALILALREAEIPARYVFADTGWEASETYQYLDTLRRHLGITIDVVHAKPKTVSGVEQLEQGVYSAMVDRVRVRAGFPGRMQRFCTRELKLEPLRAYHDQVEEETGLETVSAMGVRAQESDRRAKMPEWEDEGPRFTRERWGGYVWRPLINWTVEDVLTIHHRHGVPVNPLYLRGHDRVGCYPCIFSNKEEIRLIADHAPERIDLIDRLEQEMHLLRVARNEEEPGRYKHVNDASFFQTQRQGFTGIRKVVEWARTDYGGKQMPLLPPAPKGGCMKWGLCEASPAPSLLATPRRYYRAEFDCVSFSLVASDDAHAVELVKTWHKDACGIGEEQWRELVAEHGDPCLHELTEIQAATHMVWDERREDRNVAKQYPLTDCELGFTASSEY